MAKKVKEEELNLFYMKSNGAVIRTAPKKQKKKQSKTNNKKTKKVAKNVLKKYNENNLDKPLNKQKQDKRKISKKKVFIFFAKWTSIVALVIGGFVFLTTTPIFNISNIKIIGNEQVKYEEILSLSGLKVDTNLFKNTKNNITKNIKQNAYIDSVSIKRKLPDTIEIQIKEKQKAYMLQFMNGYAYIDNQGYILQISQDKKELPILKGYVTSEEYIYEGNRLCIDDLEKLEVTSKIMQAIRDVGIEQNISSIDITNKQEYSLYIESELKTIHLGDASNLTDKMLYAKAIIESEKDNEGEIFLNGDINNKFQPYFREKI